MAGVRCWHHDVSAVTHSEGADAIGVMSSVKPKSRDDESDLATTADKLPNSSQVSSIQNFEKNSTTPLAVQNVWRVEFMNLLRPAP